MLLTQVGVPQVSVPFSPEQASTFAPHVDALYAYLLLITIFFSTLITLLLIVFAVKYRRRQPDEVPRPRHGSMVLEVTWTVIPLLITMTIFVWGASTYFKAYRIPRQAMEVYVVGKQWMWKFQHQTGQREINELHVPVGARVKLTMTTEDVIHSLYIPAFRIKQDVVPGRYTQLWFEATKTGSFYLFCAEYCGTNHSGMGGHVIVMEPTAYQQWLAGGTGAESAASQGQKLFQERGCASCHQTDPAGQQGRGPTLYGLFGKQQAITGDGNVTVDESYIRESILDPQAKIAAGFQPIMPTFRGQLSEEQILQLIAYVRSLGQPAGGESGTAATGGGTGSGGTTTGPTTGGVSPVSQRSNPLAPTSPRQGNASPQLPPVPGRGGAANSNRQ
ncbi:MAG TPA: cytochrome c oxidase subunit II [Pyrinomonadaceae bacterium]|nr:cytochrome c oxidase subunit II [Pyrinomonadaceae bacterium]